MVVTPITPPIIDQRTTIYNAYLLKMNNADKYTLFKSRDISKVTGVDTAHVSALLLKCVKAGLVRKAGKEGNATLYELTAKGLNRGDWLFEHYNPVTNEIYD